MNSYINSYMAIFAMNSSTRDRSCRELHTWRAYSVLIHIVALDESQTVWFIVMGFPICVIIFHTFSGGYAQSLDQKV